MERLSNGKIIFNESEISMMCIATLSGKSRASIAKILGVSSDTIRRNQITHKDRINLFKVNDSGVLVVSDPSKIIHMRGEFCYDSIEVTGNPEDGIIHCNDLYKFDDDFESIEFQDYDMGAKCHIKVGKLYYRLADNGISVKGSSKSAELYDKQKGDVYYTEDLDFNGHVNLVEPTKNVDEIAITEEPEAIWNASSKFISITKGRDVYNMDSSNPSFKDALKCLMEDDINGAIDLINIEAPLKTYTSGHIHIEDGQLLYKGYEIRSGLTSRIINSMDEGEDFEFYLPFLENLMMNPSEKAVNRLFDFLIANDIEITKDGYILAWRKIRSDFKDIYTGKMDNSVGSIVSMPRNLISEDDTDTCSRGLHACAKSYLDYYGSSGDDIVVQVKIHPMNVVCIPVDYSNAKLRCCEFEVIKVA